MSGRPRGRPRKDDKTGYDGVHTGPHSGKVKFMVAIDEALLLEVKILAVTMGWSYSRLIESFCRDGLSCLNSERVIDKKMSSIHKGE